jgi:hypothetical protein
MIDGDRLDLEGQRQLQYLLAPVGAKGSGYARYGAAMYFFRLENISPQLLEVYRKCCKLDNEDPLAVALHDGILGEDEYHALSRLLHRR